MDLSAKGGAQSHANIAQGAADVPHEVMPEVTKGVHRMIELLKFIEGVSRVPDAMKP